MSEPGSARGLTATLGCLDEAFYQARLAPLFFKYAEQNNPTPLLLLAEEIADLVEITYQPPKALTRIAACADKVLSEAEAAEDLGFGEADLMKSPRGDRFLYTMERFIACLLESSTWLQRLFEADLFTAPPPPAPIEVPRSALQYWLLSLSTPSFQGANLASVDLFLEAMKRREEEVPLLRLLAGMWIEWPPYPPDRVLSSGGIPALLLETAPQFDWTLRSVAATASMATQYRSLLKRFLYLEFLREHESQAYQDALTICAEVDLSSDPSFGEMMKIKPWTPPYEALWSYLDLETKEIPSTLAAPRFEGVLPPDQSRRQAREVIRTLRSLAIVLSRARAEGHGLFLVLS